MFLEISEKMWEVIILFSFLIFIVILLQVLHAYPRYNLHSKYDKYLGKTNFLDYLNVVVEACWNEDYHYKRPENSKTDFISCFGGYPKYRHGTCIASMHLNWKIICAFLIKKGVKRDILSLIHDYLEPDIY